MLCEKGYGKCVEFDEFRIAKRGGMGVKVCTITEKTGNVAGLCAVKPTDEIMIINSEGVIIRIKIAGISTYGRQAQGVRLISMKEGVTVAGVAAVSEEDEAASEEVIIEESAIEEVVIEESEQDIEQN